jgi:ubiquinone/menaquinone biosynthesis C-methylase UbiE
MKINITFLTLFFCLSGFTLSTKEKSRKVPFTYKAYGNISEYFENEKELIEFFDFKTGEVVAEVGAGDGQNIGGLALLSNGITYYAQDINEKILNKKSFEKILKKCSKIKSPLNNEFKITIGTEKESRLPDNKFDKIIVVAALHEFTYANEMIEDFRRKLKTNGKVYILETQCFSKSHKNITAEETALIMEKQNFKLIKVDGKDKNGSKGLFRAIFQKLN